MLILKISNDKEPGFLVDKWVKEFFKPDMHYTTRERFQKRHSEKFCNVFHICRYLLWEGDIEIRSDMLC